MGGVLVGNDENNLYNGEFNNEVPGPEYDIEEVLPYVLIRSGGDGENFGYAHKEFMIFFS